MNGLVKGSSIEVLVLSNGGRLQRCGELNIAPAEFGDRLCISQIFLCRPMLFLETNGLAKGSSY